MTDDRITCQQCQNYRAKRCAMRDSAIVDMQPGDPEIARRCRGFEPLFEAKDQRDAKARWPFLFEPQKGKK